MKATLPAGTNIQQGRYRSTGCDDRCMDAGAQSRLQITTSATLVIQKSWCCDWTWTIRSHSLVIRTSDSASCLALDYRVGYRRLLPLHRYMVLKMLQALQHPGFQIALFSLVRRAPKKFALRRPSDIASYGTSRSRRPMAIARVFILVAGSKPCAMCVSCALRCRLSLSSRRVE